PAANIPRISESGVPGYEVVGWYGMTAPARTPNAVVERLNSTINRVLPELREKYENIGMDLGGGSAAEFGTFLKNQRHKWARVGKESGAKVQKPAAHENAMACSTRCVVSPRRAGGDRAGLSRTSGAA